MDSLFDSGPREPDRPGGHAESIYSVLNRRNKPPWQRVRDLVDTWYLEAPPSSQADLARRLTSNLNREFRSAFFELYCYQVLVRSGCVVEAHPTLPRTTRRPDYRADHGHSAFYLEATTTTLSVKDAGEEMRLQMLVDRLNSRVPTEQFWLDLTVTAVGPRDAALKPLVHRVKKELDRLDADQLLASGCRPTWRWIRDGWDLTFTAWPLAQAHRGDGGRIIGMLGPAGVRLVEDSEALSAALRKKATAYGRPGRPFVLALEPTGNPDDHDIIQALFGSLQPRRPTESTELGWTRLPDGLWIDRQGPAATNVSAVLTTDNLMPWTLARSTPTLWHHPAATHPLTGDLPIARQARLLPGQPDMQFTPAAADPAEFFGLEPGWPGFTR